MIRKYLANLKNTLTSLFAESKKKFYAEIARKSVDPNNRPKTYCSTMRSLLTEKKVPCIPSMFHQDEFMTEFKKKAELFNSVFANQCTLINK